MPVQPKYPLTSTTGPLSAVLEQLGCPVCHGGLTLGNDRLQCSSCGRIYPIVDGIPVLIADRAEVPRA